MNNVVRSLTVLLSTTVLCSQAHAGLYQTVGLSDSAALVYGQPGYSYCDTSAGAAGGDGKIHYDNGTATGSCSLAVPGLIVSFDVSYGTGAPAGAYGITGALYHISFTNFTLTNNSGVDLGPGDFGFSFAAGSSADFPDGVAKHVGVILAGNVIDNDGDGLAQMSFLGTAGIDYGGAGISLPVVVPSTSVSAFGSIPFFGSGLSATTFGIQGSLLTTTLYINAPTGNGFYLPGSFDVIVLGQDYTWNPTPAPVPLPAAAWLLLTGLAGLGGLARRRLN